MLRVVEKNYLYFYLIIILTQCIGIFLYFCMDGITKNKSKNIRLFRVTIMLCSSIIVLIIIENAKAIFDSYKVQVSNRGNTFFSNKYGRVFINKYVYFILYRYTFLNKNIICIQIHHLSEIDGSYENKLKPFIYAKELFIANPELLIDESKYIPLDKILFLRNLENIHCSKYTISSLKGISKFPMLTDFYCSPYNNITYMHEICLSKSLIFILTGYQIIPYITKLKKCNHIKKISIINKNEVITTIKYNKVVYDVPLQVWIDSMTNSIQMKK